jgi:hypothetical protein
MRCSKPPSGGFLLADFAIEKRALVLSPIICAFLL